MEKKVIKKSDWASNFTLIGKPVINDYTYKINEHSDKSDWVYNALNLGIDCGESHGIVYAEMMGGYGEDRENKIIKNSKDDPNKKVVINWEDRFDDDIIEEVSDSMLITVGLEKTSDGKTHYKKFLSEYDAIAYVKEHLTKDTIVNVRGNLKYSSYNDNVQVKKIITSIALSKIDDISKYKATFTQSILIDKDSASLKNIDKDKSIMYVNARVLDYLKEYNGITLVNDKGEDKGGQFPYTKQFEFPLNLENEKQCRTVYEKLFKVKKDVTQITFEGELVECGAVVTITYDDLKDDIKDLVDCGVYTLEEACSRCTANVSRERRMVLKKPMIKLVGEDKTPVIQMFPERYTESDLVLDYLYINNYEDELPFGSDETSDETSDSDSSMDWLNDL